MATEPKQRILDYGRPPLKDAFWFRLLVLFGCLLGLGIIIAMVIGRIRDDTIIAFGPGASDFSATLPHGYFIHRTSAHQIMVAPEGWNSSTPVIPTKVVELDHDDTWVIAKQQHLRRRSPNNPKDTYEEPNPGVFSYWILRLNPAEDWGPLSLADFEAKRKELAVPASLKLHDVYDYRP